MCSLCFSCGNRLTPIIRHMAQLHQVHWCSTKLCWQQLLSHDQLPVQFCLHLTVLPFIVIGTKLGEFDKASYTCQEHGIVSTARAGIVLLVGVDRAVASKFSFAFTQ